MSLPGKTNTVTIEHLTPSRDSHGARTDGAPDATSTEDAVIARTSIQGNFWKILVSGNYGAIGKAPTEWRITDDLGRIFAPSRATYRPPIERIGESEHTLIFADLFGESEAVV